MKKVLFEDPIYETVDILKALIKLGLRSQEKGRRRNNETWG